MTQENGKRKEVLEYHNERFCKTNKVPKLSLKMS
jgi:hypothetical protein